MSFASGFTPAEIQYQLSHLDETKVPIIMGAVGAFTTLATIAVFLRILVRRLKKNKYQADDYTLFIAFILTWGSFVTFYYRTQNGDGRHLLTITPDMFRRYGIAFYWSVMLYPLAQMFTQLSVLLLWKRAFTLHYTWFRISLGVIAFLSLTSNVATFIAIIFQCSPIKKAWLQDVVEGHCIDSKRLYIVHAALSLLVDLSIVVIPLPLVWGLHSNRRTKMAVTGMVLLGGLVTIINPIKIYYFVAPIMHGDITYDGEIAPAIWVHVQLCLGIVGACLPCFRPLFQGFRSVFPSQQPSASAPTSGNIRSGRSAKGSAPDQYKSLEGNEPSMTGSGMGLVPFQQQLTTTQKFPGQSSSSYTQPVVNGGRSRSTDVEQGLSMNDIGGTRDIDVSCTHAQ